MSVVREVALQQIILTRILLLASAVSFLQLLEEREEVVPNETFVSQWGEKHERTNCIQQVISENAISILTMSSSF